MPSSPWAPDAAAQHARPRRRGVGNSSVAPGEPVWMLDMDSQAAGPSAAPATPAAHRPAPDAGEEKKARAYASNPLERLENWLGLRDAPAAEQRGAPPPRAASTSSHRRTADVGSVAYAMQHQHESAARARPHEHSVDVLVHPVTPDDTVSSVALRYGADTSVVRRSNRLWPGDAPQMRECLYITVESCRWRPPNAEIQVRQRSADGAFRGEAQSPADEMLIELSDEPAAAAPPSTEPRGVQFTSVDEDELRFFTGTRHAGSMALGPGHRDYDPGESGLDDLLRLREYSQEHGTRRGTPRASEAPKPLRADRSGSSEPAWRPNVWTFGASQKRPSLEARGSQERPRLAGAESAPSAPSAPHSARRRRGGESRSETLFDATDARGASTPPAGDDGAEQKHDSSQEHTSGHLLDDLMRGLAPNSGAASHWVRPINWGDSLPALPTTARRTPGTAPGARQASPATGTGTSRGAPAPSSPHTRTGTMSNLFGDVVRGRISVEHAFDTALHELRNVQIGSGRTQSGRSQSRDAAMLPF